jgi:hypothetical protein
LQKEDIEKTAARKLALKIQNDRINNASKLRNLLLYKDNTKENLVNVDDDAFDEGNEYSIKNKNKNKPNSRLFSPNILSETLTSSLIRFHFSISKFSSTSAKIRVVRRKAEKNTPSNR